MPDPTPKKRQPFDYRSYARSFAPLSLDTLAGICRASTSDAARVAAASQLLDRAYGKPEATHEFNADIQITIRKLFENPEAELLDVTPVTSSLPQPEKQDK